jgi:hypothetical protein
MALTIDREARGRLVDEMRLLDDLGWEPEAKRGGSQL